jgi:hypothetical protein
VNRVTIIPTSEAVIKTVNDIGEQEKQPEGIEFSDLNGRITLEDFSKNDKDDDSNASDDDFVLDEECKEEEEADAALEEEKGIVGDDDPDAQEEYFQTPIQQHNTNVSNNNEPTSVTVQRSKRGNNNPIVALTESMTHIEKQECNKRRKKLDGKDTSINDNLDNDDTSANNNTKLGVNSSIDDEDNTLEDADNDGLIPKNWTLISDHTGRLHNHRRHMC